MWQLSHSEGAAFSSLFRLVPALATSRFHSKTYRDKSHIFYIIYTHTDRHRGRFGDQKEEDSLFAVAAAECARLCAFAYLRIPRRQSVKRETLLARSKRVLYIYVVGIHFPHSAAFLIDACSQQCVCVCCTTCTYRDTKRRRGFMGYHHHKYLYLFSLFSSLFSPFCWQLGEDVRFVHLTFVNFILAVFRIAEVAPRPTLTLTRRSNSEKFHLNGSGYLIAPLHSIDDDLPDRFVSVGKRYRRRRNELLLGSRVAGTMKRHRS